MKTLLQIQDTFLTEFSYFIFKQGRTCSSNLYFIAYNVEFLKSDTAAIEMLDFIVSVMVSRLYVMGESLYVSFKGPQRSCNRSGETQVGRKKGHEKGLASWERLVAEKIAQFLFPFKRFYVFPLLCEVGRHVGVALPTWMDVTNRNHWATVKCFMHDG